MQWNFGMELKPHERLHTGEKPFLSKGILKESCDDDRAAMRVVTADSHHVTVAVLELILKHNFSLRFGPT